MIHRFHFLGFFSDEPRYFKEAKIRFWQNWFISLSSMAQCLGAVYSVIESLSFFFTEFKKLFEPYSTQSFLVALFLALIVALYRGIKPLDVGLSIKGTNLFIKVVYGDFFSTECGRVVPVNEFFDSQLGGRNCHHGDIVVPSSLHGQFIKKFYNSACYGKSR
jgi:hypothetical protein